MNENPGETPNPLNSKPVGDIGSGAMSQNNGTLDANPAEPTQIVEETFTTEAVKATELDTPASPIEKVTTSVDMVTPVEAMKAVGTVETVETTGAIDPNNLVETPNISTEIVEPPMKKKTGLIVGIIIAVAALLIGGAVAAVLVMNSQKSDPVAAAMAKLMSGKVSPNIAIDGSIDFLPNSVDSSISRVGITLDSKMIMGSNINTSNAAVTLETKDGQQSSFEFDEIYAANGDLYFKIDGLTTTMENTNLMQLLNNSNSTVVDCEPGEEGCTNTVITDCVGDGNDATDCVSTGVSENTETTTSEAAIATEKYSSELLGVIETMDGEWVRVSTEEMGILSDGIVAESNLSCMVNLISDIDKNSNSAAMLYNKYPFVSSSDKNLAVASKANPVYLVNINSENFANFVNEMNNSVLSSNLYSCLGLTGNVELTANDINKITTMLPEVYVEVDANDNFTRLYVKTELDTGGEVIADLSLSYPTNVSVSEPVEYRDFSDVIQEAMSSIFVIQDTKVEEGVVVNE